VIKTLFFPVFFIALSFCKYFCFSFQLPEFSAIFSIYSNFQHFQPFDNLFKITSSLPAFSAIFSIFSHFQQLPCLSCSVQADLPPNFLTDNSICWSVDLEAISPP
jgi:hypothetical protein